MHTHYPGFILISSQLLASLLSSGHSEVLATLRVAHFIEQYHVRAGCEHDGQDNVLMDDGVHLLFLQKLYIKMLRYTSMPSVKL